MTYPIISADSHITEPPDTYRKHIEPRYRDRAPHLVHHDGVGDLFVIPGMEQPIPMGLVAAAGKRPEDISLIGTFADWHRGGWDPVARIADQERDGIAGEILYPTIGMPLCNHDDLDYKQACMDAYNSWIAEYCSTRPDRLFGIGQTAMRTPSDGIADIERIKALGLRGVMLPGHPGQADYDSPIYDPFWEAAIALRLPLSFHILTTKNRGGGRGSVLNYAVTIIRANQDIIAMLIYGGVFDRHPRLKIICVEADAGWVPHYMYRMDHYYQRHRHALHADALQQLPSAYFRENIYVTFQDDWVAFRMLDMVNPGRVMWANDFPHSDSTWPWSQDVLREHTARLTEEQRRLILHDNVVELYGLGC
jgi:predicted TIM-barrel fold metal-dependent hydrolase